MNIEKIDYINKLIDDVKVVNYTLEDVKCDTSFIKLNKGKYVLNNNKSIEREGVLKQSDAMNAVVVFAVTSSKEILMVIQPRVFLPTDTRVTIEMPAGYIDSSESVIEAAKRELLEETGYSSDKLYYIDNTYPSLGYSGENISIVLALDCKKVAKQKLDDDEFLNYFKASISEVKYLLDNGFIVDSTTKLTYYEVLDYLSCNNMVNVLGECYV